jgi:HK97 family phage major capsid protein
MNRIKRAYYLLNGNGSTPQITGFLSASGLQTQAKGSDSVPDAVHKAITKVNVTGAANASAVVMNPTDWQIVRLLTNDNGDYLYGNPSDPIIPRMWGLPVVLENQLAAGTALVGDFQMFSQIANRKGITVELGRNGDDFKTGRFTARVTSRFGLVVYRGAAFCTVTSIA